MNDPTQLISDDPKILVFADAGTDLDEPHRDLNVDVEVTVNGERWAATFFSIGNVQSLLERYAQTGECAGGTYLWAADMILVREVSAEVIRSTVSELLASNAFPRAFTRLNDG